MTSSRLTTPLPVLPREQRDRQCSPAGEGFVDEMVVQSLMLRQSSSLRREAQPRDLILAAGDADYAGWCLAPQATLLPEEAVAEQPAREVPPVLELQVPGGPKISRMIYLSLAAALTAAAMGVAMRGGFAPLEMVRKIFHLPAPAAASAHQSVSGD